MQMLVRHYLLVLLVLLASSASQASDGRVIDASTHIGIPNATVTVGNSVVTTDGSGRFHFKEASGTIMARAPGYRASRAMAKDTVTDGATIPLISFFPRALYLTVYGIGSQTLRGGAMAFARGGQINALVIDLKGDRGLIPYPTAVSLARRSGARRLTTIRDLPRLASELHRAGIYAIARIVVFKDNPLAEARSDLAVKRRDGSLFRDREGLAWVDPFQAEVRTYNIEIAVEAAEAGFDEIQFDYVRFPDVSQKLRFAQAPTEEMRVQAIDRFLTEARERLVPYNVFLSIDIFGYVCWNTNDTGIGQQLEQIVKIVDYLSPMVYPSGYKYGIPGCQEPVSHPYEIVHDTLENARRRANVSPQRFRPWLQAFRDYAFDHRAFGPSQVAEQIRAADEFGTDGWMLWNPHNRYDDLGLDTLHPLTRTAIPPRPDQ
ncbi:putative glycoside hydrolase [Edaphobacter paludis]|uniref:Glycoside hydrolase n=1 Tax=Edaphobacter paludis TaxID=3035702 RepID=A0AAU7DBH4_9BACT